MNKENFETTLCSINKYINIDDDRERYAGLFAGVRDQLFAILKNEETFRRLFNGFQLGGSYGDNVRVNKPDEFDLVFFLRLPWCSRIIVTKDTRIPGNVYLDLTNVLETMQNYQPDKIFNLLRCLIDSKNRLVVDRLQSWICGCIQRALNQLNYEVTVNGEKLKILFTRCGPAHTFWISGPVTFSLDFVPAIKLDVQQSVLSPQLRNDCSWEAIPKPLKPYQWDNCSFRASYYTAESEMMYNNYNLKNALRFMKKFRDRNQMSNLKSYYIKTLFLWKLKEKKQKVYYWSSPLNVIIIDMFDDLHNSLKQSTLKFYWDPHLNMFQGLNQNQISEMLNRVITARDTLVRAKNNFTKRLQYDVRLLFMNRYERHIEGIHNPNALKAYAYVRKDDEDTSFIFVLILFLFFFIIHIYNSNHE